RVHQNGVVATSGAHTQYIPGLLDCVSCCVAGHECMHDLWLVRVARVHAMQAKAGPDGRQAAEMLPAGETVATLNTFCFRGRKQHRPNRRACSRQGQLRRDTPTGAAPGTFLQASYPRRQILSEVDPADTSTHAVPRNLLP